jgi:formylglycine-generating enzyme required for sulfatase activity
MRVLPFIFLTVAGSLAAGEPGTAAYPLWDGSESVSDYARRVNLPPTQTLELGNNVTLELVLIPAGQFVMGTPEPPPVDEGAFRKKIFTGQALLAASAGALLIMLIAVAIRAIRQKRRPQVSLGLLLLVTLAAGGCVLSGLHWRQSARGVIEARLEYTAATARYDAAYAEEKPAHPVTLTKPFYMGKFVVTQDQYQAVAGANPSLVKGHDFPVETVSWNDAQAFCERVTEHTKQTVRLPTEAEWEFACRAGTTTAYSSGDTETDLARAAWYDGNSKGATHPVGQKEPNAFALYDMHGNVWQWCQDFYRVDYYSMPATDDPAGPEGGSEHSLRGGAWYRLPRGCRSALRGRDVPGDRDYRFGFRVVAEAATKAQ